MDPSRSRHRRALGAAGPSGVLFLLLLATAGLGACGAARSGGEAEAASGARPPAGAPSPSPAPAASDTAVELVPVHAVLNAALWMQGAVEYRSVTLQTYRAAAAQLGRALADSSRTAVPAEQERPYRELPPAVIADVDETVLDNSPFHARLLRDGVTFDPERWAAWVRESRAPPVPGALSFTREAREKGVTVFYVTNRSHELEAPTRRNLERLGFPVAEGRDVLLSKGEREGWGSDKASRRAEVARTHRVLLVLGDDLNDFVSGAYATPDARRRLWEKHRDRWGRSWFLLPNPVYGSWERARFDFDTALPEDVKVRRKLESLDPTRSEEGGAP